MSDVFAIVEQAVPSDAHPDVPRPFDAASARLKELRAAAKEEEARLEAEASRLSSVAGSWRSLNETASRALHRAESIKSILAGCPADIERLAAEAVARFDESIGFPPAHLDAIGTVSALHGTRKALLAAADEHAAKHQRILDDFVARHRDDLKTLGLLD